MDSAPAEASAVDIRNSDTTVTELAAYTPPAEKEVSVGINFLGSQDAGLAWEVNADWGTLKSIDAKMAETGSNVNLGFVNLAVDPAVRDDAGIKRGSYDITLKNAAGNVVGSFDLNSKGELLPDAKQNADQVRLVLGDAKEKVYRYYVVDGKGYSPLMGIEFKKTGDTVKTEGSTSYVFPEGTLTVYPQEWISVNDKRAMPDDRKVANCGGGTGVAGSSGAGCST